MAHPTEGRKAEAIVREQTGEVDLLSKILDEGRLVQHESQLQQAKDMIAEFVQQAMQGQMVHLAPRATLALPEGMASTALLAPRGRTAHRVATGPTALPARRATRATPALASPLAACPDRSPSRRRPLTTTSPGRTPHPAAAGGRVRRRRSPLDPSRQERPPQGRSNWLAPTVCCE